MYRQTEKLNLYRTENIIWTGYIHTATKCEETIILTLSQGCSDGKYGRPKSTETEQKFVNIHRTSIHTKMPIKSNTEFLCIKPFCRQLTRKVRRKETFEEST